MGEIIMSSKIKVEPSGPLGGYISAPPSKNYSTRYILAASMASGRSVVRRPATNDDARALVKCCRALGAVIEESGEDLIIDGVAGAPKNPGVLNPDNAGAVLRMLLGVACLVEGELRFETHHAESLGRRPNEDLLAALRQLGVEATGQGEGGLLPIMLRGGKSRLKAGRVSVSGAKSSQYLSALLFLAPHLPGETLIDVTGAREGDAPVLVSRPLIDQTLEVLGKFGAKISASEDGLKYVVQSGGAFVAGDHRVNGDWPSAAALMSAVAVAGGMVALDGLSDDAQGERRSREALTAMGCKFTEDAGRVFVHAAGRLRGIEFNGDLATDAVLALVAAACFAEGKTRFTNVANLSLKETDRIRVPLEELAKVGVKSSFGADWIEIVGAPDGYEGGVEVLCRGDHRIAQLLAIVGMGCAKGLTLIGTECISKSYPGFFTDMQRMGVKLQSAGEN